MFTSTFYNFVIGLNASVNNYIFKLMVETLDTRNFKCLLSCGVRTSGVKYLHKKSTKKHTQKTTQKVVITCPKKSKML